MSDITDRAPNPEDRPATGNQAEILFEHQGREIHFLFSLYSGREQVYVDGQLVSDRRSWRLRNQHSFEAGGVSYVLEVSMRKRVRDIFIGVINVQLMADGVLVDSDQFNGARYVLDDMVNNRTPTVRGALLLFCYSLVGAVVGFALAYFALNHFL